MINFKTHKIIVNYLNRYFKFSNKKKFNFLEYLEKNYYFLLNFLLKNLYLVFTWDMLKKV